MENQRYDYLDSLRGIAILGVILTHIPILVQPSSIHLNFLSSSGQYGVQLFYIISGYTIALSYHRRNESTARFYVRRFFRIAPMFYVAVLVYTIINGFSADYWAPNGKSWYHVVLTIFFLNGWNPETINSVVPGGWSIAIEATFYLIFPIFIRFIGNVNKTLLYLSFFFIFSCILRFFLKELLVVNYNDSQKYIVHNYLDFYFFTQFPVFIMGILCYQINDYVKIEKNTSRVILVGLLFILIGLMEIQSYADLIPRSYFYSVFFFFLLLMLREHKNIFFNNYIFKSIGVLSYSLYLNHFVAIYFMLYILKLNEIVLDVNNYTFVIVFLCILLISTCMSILTYLYVEKLGIKLGNKLIILIK